MSLSILVSSVCMPSSGIAGPYGSSEFSKFAGILSAALSQHHLSGVEIALLESDKY